MSFDASEFLTLGKNLGNVSKRTGAMAKIVVKKTAKDIEKSAKTLAPVDTGNLKNSIITSDLRNVTQDSPSAEVRASANYAQYLEFGTSVMPAQPFMGPAAEQHGPAFMAAMAEIIEKAMDS